MFQDYKQLFDNWQKMVGLQPPQVNPFNPFFQQTDIYQEFANFYKNLQNNMMNVSDFFNFQDSIKKIQQQYTDMVFKFIGLNSMNLMGINNKFLNFDMFKNFLPIQEEFLKTPAFGLTREYVEAYKKLVENYKVYTEKMEEFRTAISEKAKEGFEKFLKNFNFEDFDKAFKKWIQINEDIFQEYFKSEEYCLMQKELISAMLKFKKSMDEFTYMILKETNIATKWELDRAYKDLYNLKKEVKSLKREIKELKEELKKFSTKK